MMGQAPGYFGVVRSPMDFTTMRARLEARQYMSWDELQSDMETMFNNAMVYNPSRNRVHKQVRGLHFQQRKRAQRVFRANPRPQFWEGRCRRGL